MYLPNLRNKLILLSLLIGTLTGLFYIFTNSVEATYPSPAGAEYHMGVMNNMLQQRSLVGKAYSRAVISGEKREKTLVEYDASGDEVHTIGKAVNYRGEVSLLGNARIISVSEYRSWIDQYQSTLAYYPNGITLTDKEFEKKYNLNLDTIIVAVVLSETPPTGIHINPKDYIVLELPINPIDPISSDAINSINFIDDKNTTIKSLLLNKLDGKILYQSANTIGYKTGFFHETEDGKYLLDDKGNRKLLSPIVGAPIDILGAKGHTFTDHEGRYRLEYTEECLPGTSTTNNLRLNLRYERFNPGNVSLRRPESFYVLFDKVDYCPIKAEEKGQTAKLNSYDFRVDLILLNGKAEIMNPTAPDEMGRGYDPDNYEKVKVWGKTKWKSKKPDFPPSVQKHYDFNYDGLNDCTKLGFMKNNDGVEVFKEVQGDVTSDEDKAALVQGVWLSFGDESTCEGEPDFTRLPDFFNDSHAFLEDIGQDDLRKTDLYIFRKADGKLIYEQTSLLDMSVQHLDIDTRQDKGAFHFVLGLPGEMSKFNDIINRNTANWSGTPDELKRELRTKPNMDRLRPGDEIQIVAINRPTGYIGTFTTKVPSVHSNSISTDLGAIQMLPPNLKIWAERTGKLGSGLKDEREVTQIIGNEGVALSSDKMITVYTEWLDADGSPLPEELGEFGYTGRIAKIVSKNQLRDLSSSKDNVSHFAIQPGKKLEIFTFPEADLKKQHLYVQVTGTPSNRNPSFSSSRSGDDLVMGRPDHFVPFKVPVLDEAETFKDQSNWMSAHKYYGGDINKLGNKPLPTYKWLYRPEFQYSLYDLQVQSIGPKEGDDIKNLLNVDRPLIKSSDELIHLMYQLAGDGLTSDRKQLSPWGYDGDRELVFEFGAQEFRATVNNETQTIRLNNLQHLGLLEQGDFLTLRLYSNNDSANTLWEWGFGSLVFLPGYTKERETIEVSADDAKQYMETVLGFFSFDLTEEEIQSGKYDIEWSIEGTGELLFEKSEAAGRMYHTNVMNLSTEVGSETKVFAKMKDWNSSITAAKYRTVPGKPHKIEIISQTGQTLIGGKDLPGVDLKVLVTDQFNNRVSDGTALDIEAPDLDVTGDFNTENGIANITLTGKDLPGEILASISSKGVKLTELKVQVHDIDIKIVEFPTESNWPKTEETFPVTLSFSSAYGDLKGLPVELGARDAKVDNHLVSVDENNKIKTNLTTGKFEGTGIFYAKIGTKSKAERFQVKTRTPLASVPFPLMLDDAYQMRRVNINANPYQQSVGSSTPNGNVSIQRSLYKGKFVPFQYASYGASETTSTNVVNGMEVTLSNSIPIKLKGEPGDQLQLSLMSYKQPNLIPIFSLDPRDLARDRFPANFTIKKENIDTVRTNNSPLDGAFRFQGDGFIAVERTELLNFESFIGVTTRFKVAQQQVSQDADSSLIDYPDAGVKINYNRDRTVSFILKTEDSEQILTSSPLDPEKWHQLGAHFKDGKMILEVNDAVYTRELGIFRKLVTENKEYSIQIGNGFHGEFAEVKIFDWHKSPTIVFDDNSDNPSILPANNTHQRTAVIDDSGETVIRIKSNPVAFTENRSIVKKEFFPELKKLNPFINTAYANETKENECENRLDEGRYLNPLESYLVYQYACSKEKFREGQILVEKLNGGTQEKAAIPVLTGSTAYSTRYLAANHRFNLGSFVVDQVISEDSAKKCLSSLVTGNPVGVSGFVCEFSLSLSPLGVIADIRDVLYQNFYFLSDIILNENKFDRATYVYAVLGILTEFTKLSGPPGWFFDGVPFALKTVAKIIKKIGNVLKVKAFRHLSDFVLKYIKEVYPFFKKTRHFSESTLKAKAKLKKILPGLHLVAFLEFMAPTIGQAAGAIFELMKDEKAVKTIIIYLSNCINQPSFKEQYRKQDDAVDATAQKWHFSDLLFARAYASNPLLSTESIKELLTSSTKFDVDYGKGFNALMAVMNDVHATGLKIIGKGQTSLIGREYMKVLDLLNDLHKRVGTDANVDLVAKEIVALMSREKTVKSFLLAAIVDGKKGIENLRGFPCVPSVCTMGNMQDFLVKFAALGESNKITDKDSLKHVLAELGSIKPSDSLTGKYLPGRLNKAKGAVEVVNKANELLQNSKIKEIKFEKFNNKFPDFEAAIGELGLKIPLRRYDIVAVEDVGNGVMKDVFYECKAYYDKDKIPSDFLGFFTSLGVDRKNKKLKFGQLFTDTAMVYVAENKLGKKIDLRWHFKPFLNGSGVLEHVSKDTLLKEVRTFFGTTAKTQSHRRIKNLLMTTIGEGKKVGEAYKNKKISDIDKHLKEHLLPIIERMIHEVSMNGSFNIIIFSDDILQNTNDTFFDGESLNNQMMAA